MANEPCAADDFLTVSTVHEAEISWWWSKDKLHDNNYHIQVLDSVDAKVKELERKYDVLNDTSYCCQWEGRLLTGENRAQVEAAGNELARHLARFKGLVPLSSRESTPSEQESTHPRP